MPCSSQHICSPSSQQAPATSPGRGLLPHPVAPTGTDTPPKDHHDDRQPNRGSKSRPTPTPRIVGGHGPLAHRGSASEAAPPATGQGASQRNRLAKSHDELTLPSGSTRRDLSLSDAGAVGGHMDPKANSILGLWDSGLHHGAGQRCPHDLLEEPCHSLALEIVSDLWCSPSDWLLLVWLGVPRPVPNRSWWRRIRVLVPSPSTPAMAASPRWSTRGAG